jgi:hypothetical protein
MLGISRAERYKSGGAGPFCDLLCQQHTNECLHYTRRMLTAVENCRPKISLGASQSVNPLSLVPSQGPTAAHTAAMPNTGQSAAVVEQSASLQPSEGVVSIQTLRQAFESADAQKSRSEMNRLLARGLGLNVEEALLCEAKGQLIYLDEFIGRIKRKGVLRLISKQT